MIFNSFLYLFLFLPLVVTFYYILCKYLNGKFGILFLTVASIIFYGYWDSRFLGLLFCSIILNYSFFLLILNSVKYKYKILIFSICSNILLLFYFKYFIFTLQISNQFLMTKFNIPNIILPLGISFFTFTQIAFLVDAYKSKIKNQNFTYYVLFVTFFPHLLAGPIIHHSEMMEQFSNETKKHVNYTNLYNGLILFSIGLFKKTIIADYFVEEINCFYILTETQTINFWDAWVATLAYSIQIYFDFSGYTDMALGSALLFNINMPINFNSPYKATSIQDFWRRWHITLSRFLKDYLYIPLGGNRINWWRTELNIMIVFIIGGIWHGAGYTFIFWGFLHSFGYLITKILSLCNFKLKDNSITKISSILLTFIFINVTWVFFRASSLTNAFNMLKSMGDILTVTKFNASIFLIIFIIALTMISPNSNTIQKFFEKANIYISIIFITITIILALFAMGTNTNTPFIYFQF